MAGVYRGHMARRVGQTRKLPSLSAVYEQLSEWLGIDLLSLAINEPYRSHNSNNSKISVSSRSSNSPLKHREAAEEKESAAVENRKPKSATKPQLSPLKPLHVNKMENVEGTTNHVAPLTSLPKLTEFPQKVCLPLFLVCAF